MNTKDLENFKAQHPDALRVWYDRMHELDQGQLIETLLVHMDAFHLKGLLIHIEDEIQKERKLDNE